MILFIFYAPMTGKCENLYVIVSPFSRFQLSLLPLPTTSEPILPYNKYTTRHTHISNITVLKINLIEGECWMNAG